MYIQLAILSIRYTSFLRLLRIFNLTSHSDYWKSFGLAWNAPLASCLLFLTLTKRESLIPRLHHGLLSGTLPRRVSTVCSCIYYYYLIMARNFAAEGFQAPWDRRKKKFLVFIKSTIFYAAICRHSGNGRLPTLWHMAVVKEIWDTYSCTKTVDMTLHNTFNTPFIRASYICEVNNIA